MAKVKVSEKSPAFSFDGWELWEFLKGRKKLLVAGIGFILGYLITDDATKATISAAAVEMCFAIIEYWIKKR